ncbi:MAG: methyltransferase domain-containing protein [Rhizobiales bacterium]|nr:methyltransferase domain-containing protein [Hyphomicrobiales bacterium]MBN8985813.1 methyltransferase domain-containing protein [Hyphomicrobiales bacterium]MBN9003401.1 methyltransferase domain-containing protein [Hyphomicrobiales bacterium]
MSPEKNSKAPVLFDRALLKARQERAVRLGVATFLLDHVANDAAERLAAVNRSFASGIDLATPGDALRVALEKQGVSLRPVEITVDDSAALPFAPNSTDLAMSLLALQFVNDLPGVLTQVRRALKPDGLLLAAMVGGDTLTELRQAFAAAEAEVEGGASPHVSPFADLRDVGGLLQRAGFALPVTDFERLTVRYDNAFALMQDLRRMGATNVLVERRKSPSRRATLLRMAQIYGERFADPDGRIRATFDIVWLLGWAPDASQPKPLRPGSAKFSLEDAVRKAGEKKG